MNLKSVISPPLYKGDDEKTQRAIILNATGWSILALLSSAEIGCFIGGKTPLLIHVLNIVFFFLVAFSLYFLRHDKIPSRTQWLLALGIIYITVILFRLGTVLSPTTMAYILPIMVAGLLFGKRGVYVTTATTSLILFVLIYLEATARIPKEDVGIGITQWITYTALLGFTGNLMLVIVDTIQRYLQRAQREIVHRKKTEDVLNLYSHAIEQSPASIVITDPQGKIERVNPKFLTLTGYSAEEVIGQNPRVLKSGEHSPAFYKYLWDTISSGKAWHGEIQNRKKNGELYWEKASISPIMNSENKITHYIGIKENVTAQRETQQKIKETNQRLKEQLRENNILQQKLKQQALRDSLTGLHNRHYMDEVLEKEFARAQRAAHPISIILIDLDYLKKLNDVGGHATGDYALRSLAAQLRACTRKGDTVCRYGGDEFAIILPNTSAEEAYARAKELNQRMSALTLLYRGDQVLRISFTAGVASYPVHGISSEEIFNFADVALYRAKLKGRNRVELFSVE